MQDNWEHFQPSDPSDKAQALSLFVYVPAEISYKLKITKLKKKKKVFFCFFFKAWGKVIFKMPNSLVL